MERLTALIAQLTHELERERAERKQAELYREMVCEILKVLNETGDLRTFLPRVVEILKQRTGFDGVGIRLEDNGDFPYFSQQGFSESFLLTENTLCEEGRRGAVGSCEVRLECACGLVISGKTDPVNPFFTRGGSFWTNDSAPLLTLPASLDPRLNPRNQCVHHGYASIALIPIRCKDRIEGLIHLNDRRKGRFTLEVVELLEGIAAHIGAALMRRQTEWALRESEERYRNMVEWTPTAIVIHRAGIILYANPAAWKLFGAKSAQDLVGTPIIERMHPDFRAIALTRLADISETGAVAPMSEQKLLRLDGTQMSAEFQSISFLFEGMRAFHTSIRDITERKQAELQLELADSIVQNVQIGMFIYHLEDPGNDRSLRMVFANPAAAEFTGVNIEDMVGRTLDENFPGLREKGIPQKYSEVIRTGNPVVFEVLYYRDQRVEGAFSIKAFPLPGNYVGVSFENVTHRRQAAAALHESEEKYRSLVETAQELVWKCDGQGRFTYLNPAWEKSHGYSLNEMIGKNFSAFQRPEVYARDIREFSRHMAGGAVKEYETTHIAKDGRELTLLFNATPLRNIKGEVIGTQGTAIDVTEMRAIEMRLRQTEKMEVIGQLAGGIAHDFNNVLCGIMGYTDMSLDYAKDNPDLERNLRNVLTAADRAKHLVKQILTFSRQGTPQLSVTVLTPIIEEVRVLLRASIPSSVVMKFDLQERAKPVLADPTKIHEMLLNLVTNAVHAMGRKGVLTVKLVAESLDKPVQGWSGEITPGEYSVIYVSDTGCGMDPATLAKVFEPYFTTKAVGDGTGMGLCVVLGVVQLHGGHIQVESVVGQGTTFKIFLPVTHELSTSVADCAPRVLKGGTETILFVNDEPILVEMTRDQLVELGYQVIPLSDSQAALDLLRDQGSHIDLLITDQTMPGMTGMELAKEALKLRKDLPIILCTGYSSEVSPRRIAAVGIRECVMKPFRPREMGQLIRDVLDRK